MNIRKKRNILIFVIFPIAVCLCGLLGAKYHWALAFLTYPLMLLILGAAAKIRCPNCGVPVGKHKYKLMGYVYYSWSPFTKKSCDNCGYPLDEVA